MSSFHCSIGIQLVRKGAVLSGKGLAIISSDKDGRAFGNPRGEHGAGICSTYSTQRSDCLSIIVLLLHYIA